MAEHLPIATFVAVTSLSTKVQLALDEARMLVLGCQALIGFEFRSVFEKGFEKLPALDQHLKLASVTSLVLAFGLLLTPATYHRIVEGGEDTETFQRVLSGWMWPAVLPFLLGLSTDLFVATNPFLGMGVGLAIAVISFLFGLTLLYGLEFVQRRRRDEHIGALEAMEKKEEGKGTSVEEKVRHVLTEARLVLPGAQALLGFQLATFLMESFEKLPDSSKMMHLASTCSVALAVIFLLTPAAYHRIVERGETTSHMHKVASAMVLAATVPLALGICGDFFVVLRKVLHSDAAAAAGSAGMLLVVYGMWFGVTGVAKLRRARFRPEQRGQQQAASA